MKFNRVNKKIIATFLSLLILDKSYGLSAGDEDLKYFNDDLLVLANSSDLLDYISNYLNERFYVNLENMPINDGSVESAVDIARFIRSSLKDIPNSFKYEYILDFYKLSEEEFDVIQAVVYKEAKAEANLGEDNRYEDAFAVINSIYNRSISYTKCGYVKKWLKKDDYVTMYDHVIAPNQYVPYNNGSYKEALGVTSGEAYQAVLDFLFIADRSPECMHKFMDFLGNGYESDYRVKFVPRGNNFSYYLEDVDTIPLEERYYYDSRVYQFKGNKRLNYSIRAAELQVKTGII